MYDQETQLDITTAVLGYLMVYIKMERFMIPKEDMVDFVNSASLAITMDPDGIIVEVIHKPCESPY